MWLDGTSMKLLSKLISHLFRVEKTHKRKKTKNFVTHFHRIKYSLSEILRIRKDLFDFLFYLFYSCFGLKKILLQNGVLKILIFGYFVICFIGMKINLDCLIKR